MWSRAHSLTKLSKHQCWSTSRECSCSHSLVSQYSANRSQMERGTDHPVSHFRELFPVLSEALFMFTTFPCLDHSLCLLQWKDLHSLSFVPLTEIIVFSCFLRGRTYLQQSCSYHVFLFWFLIIINAPWDSMYPFIPTSFAYVLFVIFIQVFLYFYFVVFCLFVFCIVFHCVIFSLFTLSKYW